MKKFKPQIPFKHVVATKITLSTQLTGTVHETYGDAVRMAKLTACPHVEFRHNNLTIVVTLFSPDSLTDEMCMQIQYFTEQKYPIIYL